jgi:Kelch motif/Galactose oxidase, central domain
MGSRQAADCQVLESPRKNPELLVNSRIARQALFGLAVALILVPVSGLGAGSAGHLAVFRSIARRGTTPAGAAESSGATELAEARASLAPDGGAVPGSPAGCRVPQSTAPARGCGRAATAASPVVSHTSPNWTRVTPAIPPARYGASMANDAADKYVLLFGGIGTINYTTTYFSDTWTFRDGLWSQLKIVTSPPSRVPSSMAYDAFDKYIVLYGGYSPHKLLSDTWKFAGGKWTQLHPSSSPGPLQSAGFAYDANDSYGVLFGGSNATGALQNATWEFQSGVWTRLTTAKSPSPRYGFGMAYDIKDSYVVLFGGEMVGASPVLGDTCSFTHGLWKKLAPALSPPARTGGAMTYSTPDGKIVLFGGLSAGLTSYLSDTWSFVRGNWTKITPAAHPTSRYLSVMSDGATGGTATLFGGLSSGGALQDTWTLKGLVWKNNLPQHPTARSGASMCYDEADGYVLLFGGVAYSGGILGDTWTYSGGNWKQLHPSVTPSARYAAAMSYDQADGYVLLFGGENGTATALTDTWSFVGGTWTLVSSGTGSASSPGPRFDSGMAYDYGDGYVLLFGGLRLVGGTITRLSDTWTYVGGVWTLNSSSVLTPPARDLQGMSYDSADGYVLMFGGQEGILGHGGSDTWTYSGGNWYNITAAQTVSPPNSVSTSMVDDTNDGYVLLFGGATSVTPYLSNASWSFSGGYWGTLNPLVSPSIREAVGMAFDATDSTVVLFGGNNQTTTDGDTWTY